MEPYQFFWDAATDYGAFFYQNNQLVDSLTPTSAGQFKPGSLPLGAPFPPYQNLTPSYTPTYPEAGLTFVYPYQQIFNPGIALGAIDQTIKQPYTESWNLSIAASDWPEQRHRIPLHRQPQRASVAERVRG